MRIKNVNNKAFSLLEILLASIIFIISVAGVFATLNAVRGPVANKENQLAAAVFGKQVLEALYSQVNNSTYYTTSCANPNGDGSCGDFSLYIPAGVPSGIHEVAITDASWPAGLVWPSALTGSNAGGCSSNPCLSYTVSCADGSNGTACSSPSMSRKVDLNISWPSVP